MKLIDYFNSASVKILATADGKGQPNLCPCGTARMTDDRTIIMGCVSIDRSRENIWQTGKATFMAQKTANADYWKQYEKSGETPYPAGYRVFCILTDETLDTTTMAEIYNSLRGRVGKRVADKLKSVMTFKIEEVREVIF